MTDHVEQVFKIPFYPAHVDYQAPIEITLTYPVFFDGFLSGSDFEKQMKEITGNVKEAYRQIVISLSDDRMVMANCCKIKHADDTSPKPGVTHVDTPENPVQGQEQHQTDRLWNYTAVMEEQGKPVCPRCRTSGQVKLLEQKDIDSSKNYFVPMVLCYTCRRAWFDTKGNDIQRQTFKNSLEDIYKEFQGRPGINWIDGLRKD